jgi:hypothetical protein
MAVGDPARSKLEFIYQEVLGDVGDLVKRLEVVLAKQQEIERARASERPAEALERAAAAAASRACGDLERTADHARRSLVATLEELGAAGDASQRSRWRLYALCVALSLGSGLVVGASFVLAHLAGIW